MGLATFGPSELSGLFTSVEDETVLRKYPGVEVELLVAFADEFE
jgi:hypothetical protein